MAIINDFRICNIRLWGRGVVFLPASLLPDERHSACGGGLCGQPARYSSSTSAAATKSPLGRMPTSHAAATATLLLAHLPLGHVRE